MTFPTVAATNTSSQGSSTDSHSVSLPSGVVAGNLIVIVLGFINASGGSAPSITGFSGYTQLAVAGDSEKLIAAYYRIATGSDTATFTTNNSGFSTHNSYRITGHYAAGVPEATATAGGPNQNPNPPSESASWGADDNLWLAGGVLGLIEGGGK